MSVPSVNLGELLPSIPPISPDEAILCLMDADKTWEVEMIDLKCPLKNLPQKKIEEIIDHAATRGWVDAILTILGLLENTNPLFNRALLAAAKSNQKAAVDRLVEMAKERRLPCDATPLAEYMLPAITECWAVRSQLLRFGTLALHREREGYDLIRSVIDGETPARLTELLRQWSGGDYVIPDAFAHCASRIAERKGNAAARQAIHDVRFRPFDSQDASAHLLVAVSTDDMAKVEWVNQKLPLSNLSNIDAIISFAALGGRVATVPRIIQLFGKDRERLFHLALTQAATAGKREAVTKLVEKAIGKITPNPFEILIAVVSCFRKKQMEMIDLLLQFGESSQQTFDKAGYHLVRKVIGPFPLDWHDFLEKERIADVFLFCARDIAVAKGDVKTQKIIVQSCPAAFKG